MARATTILPAGWQVAPRRQSEASDTQVYYLQREASAGHWLDVAGPYAQRSGAVNAYGRELARQAGAVTTSGREA